jgi:hypothetical protein
MGKTNAVVADFESIWFPVSQVSYVHTISCIPVTMNTGKLSRYALHSGKGLVIKVTDVLQNKFVRDFLEAKGDVGHLEKKHRLDEKVCKRHRVCIRYMRFRDAIRCMNKFIIENGGTLLSHNLQGDLESLVNTQNFVSGPRIVKNKLTTFPNSGMYDKNWSNIKLVCTMSLFCNRCRVMNTEYKQWALENDKTSGLNRLESLVQFVKKDSGYSQTHSAVQDTFDLFTVLRYAYKCDGPILDGFSYLNEPKWLRAV